MATLSILFQKNWENYNKESQLYYEILAQLKNFHYPRVLKILKIKIPILSKSVIRYSEREIMLEYLAFYLQIKVDRLRNS